MKNKTNSKKSILILVGVVLLCTLALSLSMVIVNSFSKDNDNSTVNKPSNSVVNTNQNPFPDKPFEEFGGQTSTLLDFDSYNNYISASKATFAVSDRKLIINHNTAKEGYFVNIKTTVGGGLNVADYEVVSVDFDVDLSGVSDPVNFTAIHRTNDGALVADMNNSSRELIVKKNTSGSGFHLNFIENGEEVLIGTVQENTAHFTFVYHHPKNDYSAASLAVYCNGVFFGKIDGILPAKADTMSTFRIHQRANLNTVADDTIIIDNFIVNTFVDDCKLLGFTSADMKLQDCTDSVLYISNDAESEN